MLRPFYTWRHERVRRAFLLARSRFQRLHGVVSRSRGQSPARKVPDLRSATRRRRARSARRRPMARSAGRNRRIPETQRSNSVRRSAAAAGTAAPEPARSRRRARAAHARALQFLPLGLPRRPYARREARRLQARLRDAGLVALSPPRRGAHLPRHARLGHAFLHLDQHALLVLPERG